MNYTFDLPVEYRNRNRQPGTRYSKGKSVFTFLSIPVLEYNSCGIKVAELG